MKREGIANIDLPEPWIKVSPLEINFEAELKKELGIGHPLFGRTVRAIARRADNDDVLFEVSGCLRPFAVVHLTWSGKIDQDPRWPATTTFSNLEKWRDDSVKAEE